MNHWRDARLRCLIGCALEKIVLGLAYGAVPASMFRSVQASVRTAEKVGRTIVDVVLRDASGNCDATKVCFGGSFDKFPTLNIAANLISQNPGFVKCRPWQKHDEFLTPEPRTCRQNPGLSRSWKDCSQRPVVLGHPSGDPTDH